MKSKHSSSKRSADKVIKDIRRKTRRHFSAEDKIRIVLEGLRGDDSIAELCRQEALADRPSRPRRVWNRIPKKVHDQIIGWGRMYLGVYPLSIRESIS